MNNYNRYYDRPPQNRNQNNAWGESWHSNTDYQLSGFQQQSNNFYGQPPARFFGPPPANYYGRPQVNFYEPPQRHYIDRPPANFYERPSIVNVQPQANFYDSPGHSNQNPQEFYEPPRETFYEQPVKSDEPSQDDSHEPPNVPPPSDADFHMSVWLGSEEEEKGENVDKKNRRIISRQELFAEIESPEVDETPPEAAVELLPVPPPEPEPSIQPVQSWTKACWRKAGEASQEPLPETTQRAPAPNMLHKKLEKALAQPAQMSKAESMMAKMGWQGGALGKTGEGILEPIAPNAVYAWQTRGLGHTVEDPPCMQPRSSNKSPKKHQRPPKKLPKEKTLSKKAERKLVIMNKIAIKQAETKLFKTNVLNVILDFVKNYTEMEIVFDPKLKTGERKKIHRLVHEVINSDSQRETFVSDDLREIVHDILKYNNYVLCTQSEGTIPNRALCLFKEAPNHVYLIMPVDLNDKIPEDDDLDHEHHAECGNDSDDSDSAGKVAKNSKKKKRQDDYDSDIEIIDDVMVTTVSAETTNPFLESIANPLKTDVPLTAEEDVSNIDENNKDIANKFEQDCIIVDEVEETPQVIDITYRIVKYFVEFTEGNSFTEMRFLGKFDGEEIGKINEFIKNLHGYVNTKQCIDKDYEGYLKCLDGGDYTYAIKEDINGSVFIHKLRMKENKKRK